MANPRMTLLDLLNKAEQGADPDFLRDGLRLLAQELMEAEVSQLIGAELHERSETRTTHATATGSESGTPGWGPWSWRSPSCARAPTAMIHPSGLRPGPDPGSYRLPAHLVSRARPRTAWSPPGTSTFLGRYSFNLPEPGRLRPMRNPGADEEEAAAAAAAVA
jgi:Transposase, Mutator family